MTFEERFQRRQSDLIRHLLFGLVSMNQRQKDVIRCGLADGVPYGRDTLTNSDSGQDDAFWNSSQEAFTRAKRSVDYPVQEFISSTILEYNMRESTRGNH